MPSRIQEYLLPLPQINTEQMIEVDRLMMEEYQIGLPQMMENAGRALAIVASERFCKGSVSQKKILILAGSGGNGGGAIVAARRLATWGAEVFVVLAKSKNHFKGLPLLQFEMLEKMGVDFLEETEPPDFMDFDLIIDGIIGYSIKGNPHGFVKSLIEWCNLQNASVLSLDAPSGLNLSSGLPSKPTIKAEATMTLALPKLGLFSEEARPLVGDLFLADLSVPPALYEKDAFNLKVGCIFEKSDILKIG